MYCQNVSFFHEFTLVQKHQTLTCAVNSSSQLPVPLGDHIFVVSCTHTHATITPLQLKETVGWSVTQMLTKLNEQPGKDGYVCMIFNMMQCVCVCVVTWWRQCTAVLQMLSESSIFQQRFWRHTSCPHGSSPTGRLPGPLPRPDWLTGPCLEKWGSLLSDFICLWRFFLLDWNSASLWFMKFPR